MIKQQAIDVIDFLLKYQSIWHDEVLNTYPEYVQLFPKDLMSEIQSWDQATFQKIIVSGGTQGLKNSPHMKRLSSEIKQLAYIQEEDSTHSFRGIYAPEAYYQVKGKKEHEFHQLIPILKEKAASGNYLIDIGSGIGYLAQMLASQESMACECIDQDQKLQEQGKMRWSRYFKQKQPIPNYQQAKISSANHLEKYINGKSLVLGLHACGELTDYILQASVQNNAPAIVSLGCCYYKRPKGLKGEAFLAKLFQASPLDLSIEALSLATNAHLPPDTLAFQEKQKIKFFRYLFQLILFHECDVKGFLILGSTPLSLYQEWSFEQYFIEQWQRLYQHACPFTYLEIENHRKKWHNEAFLLFKLNSVRSLFGPLIEKAISLDHGLYLANNGYLVEIKKVFNEKTSPRNTAIIASK